MGDLLPGRELEVVLGALHELAESVGLVGHGGAEERPDDDLKDGGPADPVQVDLVPSLCRERVDGGVGLFDDHRDPPIEAPSAERGLDCAAAAGPVVAVGGDHRLLADDDGQGVELVVPTKVPHRAGEQAPHLGRTADDRHSSRAEAQPDDGPEVGAQLVEHRLWIGEHPHQQRHLSVERWMGRSGRHQFGRRGGGLVMACWRGCRGSGRSRR